MRDISAATGQNAARGRYGASCATARPHTVTARQYDAPGSPAP